MRAESQCSAAGRASTARWQNADSAGSGPTLLGSAAAAECSGGSRRRACAESTAAKQQQIYLLCVAAVTLSSTIDFCLSLMYYRPRGRLDSSSAGPSQPSSGEHHARHCCVRKNRVARSESRVLQRPSTARQRTRSVEAPARAPAGPVRDASAASVRQRSSSGRSERRFLERLTTIRRIV